MDLSDPLTLSLIVLSYVLGSIVKGVTGFGAILVAVPLMSILVEPATAVALTGVSVVTSNVWQLWDSRNAKFAIEEFWKVIIPLLPASVLGAQFLAVVDPRIASAVIGTMVVLFCLTQMFPVRPQISEKQRKYADPLIGVTAGLVGGASILTGSVLVAYLMSINLKKDQFVAAIALLYLVNTVPIYVTLSFFDRYDFITLVISVSLVVPAILGLILGRSIRDKISQKRFERVVDGMLFLIGCLLIQRALVLL